MKHDNSLVVNADGATTDEGKVSKEREEEEKIHPCLKGVITMTFRTASGIHCHRCHR